MGFKYPHIIDNGSGEQITFKRVVNENGVEYVEVENIVSPGAGPPMHVHFKQEESLTVVKGKIATQVLGEEPKYFNAGETIIFKPGVVHKFWNAGNEPMECKGYIKPTDNIVYFLTEIYRSTKENGGKRPGNFDAAYLLNRYRSEFDIMDVPSFVKKTIFPLTIFFGKLAGKHKKFADAPQAVK